MKLKFKRQLFQSDSVQSIVDCFEGQGFESGIRYRIDPGRTLQPDLPSMVEQGFKNHNFRISHERILENTQTVQRRHGLIQSSSLVGTLACPINFDIEMETGTGKTYTIQGPNKNEPGVAIQALDEIFKIINDSKKNLKMLIKINK